MGFFCLRRNFRTGEYIRYSRGKMYHQNARIRMETYDTRLSETDILCQRYPQFPVRGSLFYSEERESPLPRRRRNGSGSQTDRGKFRASRPPADTSSPNRLYRSENRCIYGRRSLFLRCNRRDCAAAGLCLSSPTAENITAGWGIFTFCY